MRGNAKLCEVSLGKNLSGWFNFRDPIWSIQGINLNSFYWYRMLMFVTTPSSRINACFETHVGFFKPAEEE
jgi:hypothetical protein